MSHVTTPLGTLQQFNINNWLLSMQCSQYLPLFQDLNIVTLDLILQLDYESLKEIGVSRVGDLLRLERSIIRMQRIRKIKRAKKTGKVIYTLKSDELVNHMVEYMSSRMVSLDVSNQHNGNLTKRSNNEYSPSNEQSTNKPLMANNNNSSSTINSIDSTDTISSANNASTNSTIILDKSIASFILSSGSVKKMNISGCYTAEQVKKKLLKKLNMKNELPESYRFFYVIHENNGKKYKLHLMFDVELVSLVRLNDRFEKNRIIFCKVDENPTKEALQTSKKVAIKNKEISKEKKEKELSFDATLIQPRSRKQMFEQRPPSELISSNLAEYFPETSSSELKQTIKNSVRYSVRMSRAYSRLSMMMPANKLPTMLQSRTVGDVLMNNANEIDEAVLGDDKDFMNIMNSYKQRPKSRFIPGHNAPPLPLTPPSASPNNTLVSDSNSRRSSIRKNRLSVAVSKNSKIELMDVDGDSRRNNHTALDGSDGGINGDDDDDLDDDLDDVMNDLLPKDNFGSVGSGGNKDSSSDPDSLYINTGPKHWLKGKKIGAGSFGSVYLGLNSFTGELMAVKQVEIPNIGELEVSTQRNNEDEDTLKGGSTHQQSMIEALQREMALLKELKHEKIVRYLGSLNDGTYLNIFLEYVPGGSITAMLNNYGPFKEPLIRNFTRQILIGLKYLHSKNIIHRDIKGGNILIDNNGGAKISDFGISKKIETSNNKRASMQGSVYWMAPEVVKQIGSSSKSDIWSLGCLIIEMFTGKHPFPEFSQMQAIFKLGMSATPQIPEGITEDGKNFLQKTFIIEYDKRPSANELLKHSFLNSLIIADN